MIFAAVGTQLPFPRLLTALDDIAVRHDLDILAQTADPGFVANHIRVQPFFEPTEFDSAITRSSLLVGHAGIGLILAAKRFAKPVILYPRHAALGEHRNDHQLATVKSLGPIQGVYIAMDNTALEQLLTEETLEPANAQPGANRDPLVDRIRTFMAGID